MLWPNKNGPSYNEMQCNSYIYIVYFFVYFQDKFRCLNLWTISLVAQMVKNLPTIQETWVWYLGWEDPLEEGMATHSSILAWRIPWTEEPGGL